MPEITVPNIPAVKIVRPILPAFTSSPWGNHSLNDPSVIGQDTGQNTVTIRQRSKGKQLRLH